MTRRERGVVALIAAGLSNKEIAERLGIASHTVKSHVRNVMDKLTVHSLPQTAAYAHEQRRNQPLLPSAGQTLFSVHDFY